MSTPHRAVIDARGRDSRGNGTANAKVTATLTAEGASTTVHVVTDLDITGKPAQFGRGVMVDVGNKLIGQFADCLAGKLAGGSDDTAEECAGRRRCRRRSDATVGADDGRRCSRTRRRTASPPIRRRRRRPSEHRRPPGRPVRTGTTEVEPINLIESAGPAIAKRLVPVAIAAVLLFLILRRRTRRTG